MLQLGMTIIRRRKFGKVHHHHFVYVDEFRNFANTDFHTLVAEARKFNIGFTLANQNLEQLREFRTYTGYHEERLINAIFGNVGNFIVFGVGAFDAKVLSDQLSVAVQDIMRISRYQALVKFLVNSYDTTSFTLYPEEAIWRENPRNIAVIEKDMREGGYWIETNKVGEEISCCLDRLIERARTQKPIITDDFAPVKQDMAVIEELTGHETIEEHIGTLPPKMSKNHK